MVEFRVWFCKKLKKKKEKEQGKVNQIRIMPHSATTAALPLPLLLVPTGADELLISIEIGQITIRKKKRKKRGKRGKKG